MEQVGTTIGIVVIEIRRLISFQTRRDPVKILFASKTLVMAFASARRIENKEFKIE
jgi:hypothetical protein